MSAHANPNIITDGLAFMYDTESGKSYRGEPTINYIHSQNAVAKDSYSAYSATSSGTYNAKHPNAIIAYNAAGSQISGYYNGGVTDATNTYHAHWQYDPILKKPVVVMNDFVGGQWKAKWMGTGLGSWNSQGKSHGDTYTISWLQWVDHLSKNAKAGLYTKNTSGSNGFHDGQANSASSYNTKLRTWQRVYQTYTTNSVRDLSQTLASIYMYGHYNVRATVKVADVQFTWGDHPVQFSAEYERTATQGLLDLTNTATIDLSNVSFDSDAQVTFDGTDDQLTVNNIGIDNYSEAFSYECVFKAEGTWANGFISNIVGIVGSYAGHYGLGKSSTNTINFVIRDANYNSISATVSDTSSYHHLVGVWDQSNSQMRLYIDGELKNSATVTKTGTPDSSHLRIGGRAAFGGDNGSYYHGDIPIVKYYKTALTTAEVLQNFNATKDRFGL